MSPNPGEQTDRVFNPNSQSRFGLGNMVVVVDPNRTHLLLSQFARSKPHLIPFTKSKREHHTNQIMNAFRLRTIAQQAARRSKATVAGNKSFLPPQYQSSFKENWLSDPSTYPIIVIMTGGLSFMVGMGLNALFGYKDVQIDPNKRGKMLQDWGEEHRSGVVETFAKAKGGVNPEGLGIDHEKWTQQKTAYMKSSLPKQN